MFGVAAAQFAADLRIESLPESREIGCGLNGPLIGGEQMNYERRARAADARGLAHSEEVLKPRGDPGRFSALVVHFCLTAVGKPYASGGGVLQIDLLFEGPQQTCVIEVREASQALAKAAQYSGGIGKFETGECGARVEFFEIAAVRKAVEPGLEGFVRKQSGGLVRIGNGSARFLNHKRIVEQGADGFHPLRGAVPFDGGTLLDTIGEKIDEPLGFDPGDRT